MKKENKDFFNELNTLDPLQYVTPNELLNFVLDEMNNNEISDPIERAFIALIKCKKFAEMKMLKKLN